MTVTSYYGTVKWAIHFATIVTGQWTIFGFFRSPVLFGSRLAVYITPRDTFEHRKRLQGMKVHHYPFRAVSATRRQVE